MNRNSAWLKSLSIVMSIVLVVGLCPGLAYAKPLDSSNLSIGMSALEGEQTISSATVKPATYLLSQLPVSPVVTAYDANETEIAAEGAFTISYKKGEAEPTATPTEAGKYQVVLTGAGDYEGSTVTATGEVTFIESPIALTDYNLEVTSGTVYNGSDPQEVVVKGSYSDEQLGEIKLYEGVDYTVTIKTESGADLPEGATYPTEKGSYIAVVDSISGGAATGTFNIPFIVDDENNISRGKGTIEIPNAYAGKVFEPSSIAITMSEITTEDLGPDANGNVALTQGTDFKFDHFEYENTAGSYITAESTGLPVGACYAVVTGEGKWAGSLRIPFMVTVQDDSVRDIVNATITGNQVMYRDAESLFPITSVTLGGNNLQLDTDYTVTYYSVDPYTEGSVKLASMPSDPGYYRITIMGKNLESDVSGYFGSKSFEYEIREAFNKTVSALVDVVGALPQVADLSKDDLSLVEDAWNDYKSLSAEDQLAVPATTMAKLQATMAAAEWLRYEDLPDVDINKLGDSALDVAANVNQAVVAALADGQRLRVDVTPVAMTEADQQAIAAEYKISNPAAVLAADVELKVVDKTSGTVSSTLSDGFGRLQLTFTVGADHANHMATIIKQDGEGAEKQISKLSAMVDANGKARIVVEDLSTFYVIVAQAEEPDESLENVRRLINLLRPVENLTLADVSKFEDAWKAYNLLEEEQKAKLGFEGDWVEILFAAKDRMDPMIISRLIELIESFDPVTDLTLDDEADVKEARSLYGSLTETQQDTIGAERAALLESAEARIAELKAKQQAVEDAKKLIDALEPTDELTLADADRVNAARAAYDALDDDQKARIAESLPTLLAAEGRIAALKAEAEAIENVKNLIEALQPVNELTLEDEDALNKALEAYNALTDEQKAALDEALGDKGPAKEQLDAASTRIQAIKDGIIDIDEENAAKLIEALKPVSNLTLDDAARVQAARQAFNKLSDEKQENLGADAKATLEAAEERMAALEVEAMINALLPIENLTLDDADRVAQARAAYNSLEDSASALIPNAAVTLAAAEARINALKNPKIEQFAGGTRFETARMIVDAELELGSYKGAIIVAGDGQKFPDALSAAGLSGVLGYPLVMVDGNELTSDSISALNTLKEANGNKALDLIIVGGEAAVSKKVANALSNWGKVSQRIRGDNRYETNAAVYKYGASHGGWSTDTTFIATGANFPDALAIAPYLVKSRSPIVFVSNTASSMADIPADGWGAILNAQQVIALGGKAVVPDAILNATKGVSKGKKSNRLFGETRYETGAKIVEWELKQGMSVEGTGVATGKNFPDALASGFLLGKSNAVLVLVDQNELSSNSKVVSVLNSAKASVAKIRALGGDNAVTAKARSQIAKALNMEKPVTTKRK